jgi:hypothetical protein
VKKFFICCEGVTDVGVLIALVEKCITVSAECKTHDEIKHIKVLKLRSTKRGSSRDADVSRKAYIRRIAHITHEQNSNYFAYHQDAGRKYERVYEDINCDFDEYIEKGFHCIAIVPKEMTESWLLADEQAFFAAFGRKPENPALNPKPEELWGEKMDPDSNYPKHVIKRVLAQYHKEPNRDTYTEIASNCNINTLKNRCESFTRFYNDLLELGGLQ